MWCANTEEYRAVFNAWPKTQVGDDSLAYVARERQVTLRTPLAANYQLALPPIDVLKAQINNLTRSECQSHEKMQHGEISAAHGRPRIARCEYPLDLLRLQSLRY